MPVEMAQNLVGGASKVNVITSRNHTKEMGLCCPEMPLHRCLNTGSSYW
jgi:hypothetical protein